MTPKKMLFVMKKQLANVKCTRVFASLALLMLFSAVAPAQTLVNKEWSVTTGEPSPLFDFSVSTLDSYQNWIVVGNTNHPTQQTNFLMTKYNPKGELLWQLQYDKNSGIDYATSVTSFGGFIYVTGASFDATHGNLDYLTLKISEQGQILWEARYDNGGMDVPSSIQVDVQGNLFVTGGSWSNHSNYDCLTLKYDANGVQKWATRYDYSSGYDFAMALTPDNAGGCVVTGASGSSLQNWDFVALRYNFNGVTQDVQRMVSPDNGFDKPVDIKKDAQGHFYILGSIAANQTDIKIVKLNSQLGVEWTKTFDGGFADEPAKMQLDHQGNVYVVGYSTNDQGGKAFITLKYDNAGNEMWSRQHFAEQVTQTAEAKSVDVDTEGHVLVTGKMQQKDGSFDYLTVQYDENGETLWEKTFDNHGLEEAKDIHVDGNKNVYVLGKTTDGTGVTQYSTVKYTYKEQVDDYLFDLAGKPLYVKGDVIVKFRQNALQRSLFYQKDFMYGTAKSFLTPLCEQAISNSLDLNLENVSIRRIFRELTPDDTISMSRLNERIPIPDVWTTLVFRFSPQTDVIQVSKTLSSLSEWITFAQANYAGVLQGANDPEFSIQKSLSKLAANDSVHVNVDSAWVAFETGKPFVRVGIFDSGIQWKHEDFGYVRSTDKDSVVVAGGWDYIASAPLKNVTTILSDSIGHGTAVAGIIGAIRNNSKGIAGIGGGDYLTRKRRDSIGVQLYGYRITGARDNFVKTSTIADAVMNAALNPTTNPKYGSLVHIMNHSWGSEASRAIDSNFLLKVAIHAAFRNKVTTVAARGNHASAAPTYPATFYDDWIINVSATNDSGRFARRYKITPLIDGNEGSAYDSLANVYEGRIDVAAPGSGVDVCRLLTTSLTGYSFGQGTSFSAPHVSGGAALLLSYINASYDTLSNLAPEDVENLMQLAANDVTRNIATGRNDAIGYDRFTGHGKLNVYQTLNLVKKNGSRIHHIVSKPGTIRSIAPPVRVHTQQYVTFEEPITRFPRDFHVDIYKVSATVNHTGLNVGERVVNAWALSSMSNLADTLNWKQNLSAFEFVRLKNYTQTTATIEGFVYELKNPSGGASLGWFPFHRDSLEQKLQLGYSLLLKKSTPTQDIMASQPHLKIYPNPMSTTATIEWQIPSASSEIRFDIFDMLGRKVQTVYRGRSPIGMNRLELDLSHLTNGLYIASLSVDGVITSQKFTKIQ
jgi:subtilisin family serine protease